MTMVLSITPLTSARSLIELADGTSFPLYQRELHAYRIEEGQELDEAAGQELFGEILPKRARLRAMHLLEKTDRTEWQLRKKLRESGYSGELENDAVEYVRSYHYIDDVRYAFHYMDYRKETRSRFQLQMELKEKGVSQENISSAMEQVEFPRESDQIRVWMQKRRFDPETADWKEKQKMIRFLTGKGFSMEAIRAAFP